jgi:D-alanyl-D-alanine carboxypeptidase/D-alanyl-D-alanine-endopeptidase (penicillin-binding protein 4)
MVLSIACLITGGGASAQTASVGATTLAEQVHRIIDRPEFHRAMAGVEIYSLDTHEQLLAINADKLFVPGSTTKLSTTATALDVLGGDYRFHTRVYRTGPIAHDGTLKGDLVLVASGDPDLSGRIMPGDTLAFTDEDHSYGGSPDTRAVPGDPLAVIRELAQQVKAHHVTRITGHVMVDARLFAQGDRELGTGVVISPIVVNDNVIDVTVAPASREGVAPTLSIAPSTSYVRFVNQATTGAAGSPATITFKSDSALADGSRVVTIAGTIPASGPSILYSYPVADPQRFAEMAFVDALRAAGVTARVRAPSRMVGGGRQATRDAADVVAEHVSLPFGEEVKVTLKVSQNLHASMMPYVLSALRGPADSAPQPGFDVEHAFLTRAGLDLTGAMQSDGAGGLAEFTPDFMVHFLTYMASRPDYPVYLHALPILGRDGTLAKIQRQSPAAGHVFAKTGTYVNSDALNRAQLVAGKGLAGYITTADGRHLVFAAYFNNVAVPAGASGVEGVGQALGEIAAAAYGATAQRAQIGGGAGAQQ